MFKDILERADWNIDPRFTCNRHRTRPLRMTKLAMAYTDLASSAAIPQFSNVTMALVVDDEIWIGTFAGDRVAYRALGEGD